MTVEPLDPDPELVSELESRPKWFLERLYEVFADDVLDTKAPTLREVLADRHTDQVRQFLEDYEILSERNVNRRYAEEYLNKSLGISREDLDVRDRYELLLVVYENGCRDKLRSMIIRSELFAVKNEREFQLDQELNLDGVENRVTAFLRKANVEEQHLDPIQTTVDENESSVALDIRQEYGRKYRNVFAFRQSPGQENVPVNPSVEGTSFYPLRNMSIGVEPKDGETVITFSKSTDNWEGTLTELFSDVFGVGNLFQKLEEKSSPGVQEIQQDTIAAVEDESTDTADTVREAVQQRTETAAEQIDQSDEPEETKEDLKQRVETFRLVGYSISNDQATSTDEFTIIADDLNHVFGTIEGIELSFEDYLEKAEKDNIQLIFKIQNEHVKLSAGDWEPLRGPRITAGNKEALEILLSEMDEPDCD
ncbi:hypothetical protein [Halomarina pelagica]|uniref:hypothetical protein n=1 Tax=Halomarina pelagica TaxID=2961599 RepID=UPI0020C3C73D|nr:hypothetical protein [Halomarina sp. BND7]